MGSKGKKAPAKKGKVAAKVAAMPMKMSKAKDKKMEKGMSY